MILSDRDILALIERGKLNIDPQVHREHIGPTSIDLHLGNCLLKYTDQEIVLGKTYPKASQILMDKETGYLLMPGEFVLACTLEKIEIPNGYQGFIETKGDIARAGKQVHNADGHIDPGSNHTITLEVKNNNHIPIRIFPEILICQIFLYKLMSESMVPYKGKYYGQKYPSLYQPK